MICHKIITKQIYLLPDIFPLYASIKLSALEARASTLQNSHIKKLFEALITRIRESFIEPEIITPKEIAHFLSGKTHELNKILGETPQKTGQHLLFSHEHSTSATLLSTWGMHNSSEKTSQENNLKRTSNSLSEETLEPKETSEEISEEKERKKIKLEM